jgi:hypothetical protein
MTGWRVPLRWGMRILGTLVVLMAAGDLLLEQEAVSSPESKRMTNAPPVANLALHMKNVVLPPPPPRTVPERTEISEPAGIPESAPAGDTVRAVAAPKPDKSVPSRPADTSSGGPQLAPARVARAEGEHLLARAERGELSLARIAWPESADERARLDTWLHDCIGVRNALLSLNRIVAAEPDIEADATRQFSGIVRRIEGVSVPAETRRLARLRARGATGAAIRLFPRDFDAVLLGTLSSMGALQPDARVRYRFGARLMLEAKGETTEVPIGFVDRCSS